VYAYKVGEHIQMNMILGIFHHGCLKMILAQQYASFLLLAVGVGYFVHYINYISQDKVFAIENVNLGIQDGDQNCCYKKFIGWPRFGGLTTLVECFEQIVKWGALHFNFPLCALLFIFNFSVKLKLYSFSRLFI
jgi:hypothetical protein